VFTRKLVASIEQRIMLEKALGQVKLTMTGACPILMRSKSTITDDVNIVNSDYFQNYSFDAR